MVWQGSGADPLNPKVVRSSSGAVLRLPLQRFGPAEADGIEELKQTLRQARDRGLQVVATLVPGAEGPASVVPYWGLDWRPPTVLVLGNEGRGLHPNSSTAAPMASRCPTALRWSRSMWHLHRCPSSGTATSDNDLYLAAVRVSDASFDFDVIVIGAGYGGFDAAKHAADHGLKVAISNPATWAAPA